jgi:tRNA threonylcarbamoyladenosine biosynthesis protein TsaE
VSSLNLETYWEGIEVTPGIVAIEWAQRMPYQPDSYLMINLIDQPEGTRQAEIIPVNFVVTLGEKS